MVRSFMERDCDWRKKQKWREGDQEVDRQEGLALQEEAILGNSGSFLYSWKLMPKENN